MTPMDILPGGKIDVSKLPLKELWKLREDSALSRILREVAEPDDDDDDAPQVSAFNSGL